MSPPEPPCPRDECACGDYRKQHAGPENRGSCLICRDGKPPPDGPDGCQRFRLAFPAHGPGSRRSLRRHMG